MGAIADLTSAPGSEGARRATGDSPAGRGVPGLLPCSMCIGF